jgi:hypothetical protein
MLWEMGRRLVGFGVIAQPDDIFWLTQDEADQPQLPSILATPLDLWRRLLKHRKAVIQAERQLTPPPVLPPKSKWMGLDLGYVCGG